MDDQETHSCELAGYSETMTTQDKQAWYHCGHCGSLFQSNYGFDESRLCTLCQCKPVVGFRQVMKSISPVISAKVADSHESGHKIIKKSETPPTNRRAVRIVFWVVIVWILVLLAVIAYKFYLKS